MPRSRPPKAAGTYGMLDMIRQPSRLGQLPPAATESLGDIAALERGEARLVSCYLRYPPASGGRTPWLGGLELTAASVSWRPFFGLRRPARVLDITGVALVRPAGHSDQRFGVPGNLHLFSLVRCATPVAYLDLLVPTADLPLVTWRLGSANMPPSAAAIGGVQAGRASWGWPPSGRQIRWQCLAGVASVLVAVALIAAGYGRLALVPENFGTLMLAMSLLGTFRVRRDRRNAPQKSRHKGAS